MIDSFKRAFKLNHFDYIAADALALTYNVSGPDNAELVTLWERRRDKAMMDISISMDCATKNNRLLSRACEAAPPAFSEVINPHASTPKLLRCVHVPFVYALLQLLETSCVFSAG